jgi:glycerol uptake facilitator-like aquaporin
MNDAKPSQLFVFEFIGVFLFTFGYCSVVINYEIDAQAASSILTAIFVVAPLTGANLNPMITLSNCIKKENKYKWNRLYWYIIAQLLGGIAGLFFSELMGRKMLPELIFKN